MKKTRPLGPSRILAQVVSTVLSPPLVAAACLWFAAGSLFAGASRAEAAVYMVLGIAVPLLYAVWLLKNGRITDLDVSLRKQRRGPMLVMVICGAIAWLLLWVFGASREMLILTGAFTLQSALTTAITLRWKISQHGAMSTWAGQLGRLLIGTHWAWLTVPLVLWSRVRLGRHTASQATAGALVGLVISSSALWLIRVG